MVLIIRHRDPMILKFPDHALLDIPECFHDLPFLTGRIPQRFPITEIDGIRDVVNCHDSHKAAAMHPQKSVPDLLVVRYTWSPSTWIFAYFPFIRTYKIVLTLKAIVFLAETIVMYLSSGMKQFLRKILYFIEAFISEIISGFHSRINSTCTRCRNLDF